MKKDVVIVGLCLLFVSHFLVSCGHEHSLDAPIISITTSEQLNTTTKTDIDTIPTEVMNSFNMDDTLRNTYLCGVQLAPDLTWGMLGDDFTIDSQNTFYSKPDNVLSCYLYYKNLYLGVIGFIGCENINQITDESKISSFMIQNDNIDLFDVPKITVCGIKLNDQHNTLYSILGNNYSISGINDNVKYIDTESKRQYNFIFNTMGEDRLVTIFIVVNV